MKIAYRGFAVLIFAICTAPVSSQASSCGVDFQHAYEEGVRIGRTDGSHQESNNPTRHAPHLYQHIEQGKRRAECWLEGYNIGYDNAYADSTKYSYNEAPEYGSNERDYYDDGCREGTGDAQMNMSMAYERHSDMYDRRFEPSFREGYEACWQYYR